MFKRFTAFMLALITVFALVACDGGVSDDTTAAEIIETTAEITEVAE